MYWPDSHEKRRTPREKKFWESNKPPTTSKWSVYNGPQVVSQKALDTGRVVQLDRKINGEKVLQWVKDMNLCKHNHFHTTLHLVITFKDEESASLCKLTWGGELEND